MPPKKTPKKNPKKQPPKKQPKKNEKEKEKEPTLKEKISAKYQVYSDRQNVLNDNIAIREKQIRDIQKILDKDEIELSGIAHRMGELDSLFEDIDKLEGKKPKGKGKGSGKDGKDKK